MVDAGPEATYEEKNESTPPPPELFDCIDSFLTLRLKS